MQNVPRPFVTIALVTSLLLSSVSIAAQAQANDWAKVTALSGGSNLAVKLKSGKTIKGTLSSVSDTTLSLTVKNGPMEIKRDDVRTVHEVVKKGSGAKGALIGTAVGAGAGAGIGAIGDAAHDGGFAEGFDDAAVAALAVLGAGAGAIAGYFIGRRGSKKMLVYEAK